MWDPCTGSTTPPVNSMHAMSTLLSQMVPLLKGSKLDVACHLSVPNRLNSRCTV